MDFILNKGYHNTVEKIAIPCDLKEKIFEARDKILASDDEYAKEDYEDMFKEYFENWNEETYSIGGCIQFLSYYGREKGLFDEDVNIYTSERYLASNDTNSYLTKLSNGADIIVILSSSEEIGTSMYQALYYDGEMLKIFTPYEGNMVNIITNTCLGNEMYADDTKINYSHILMPLVFPEGLSKDMLDDLYSNEEYLPNYLRCFGAKTPKEQDVEYCYSDEKLTMKEIESVLTGANKE